MPRQDPQSAENGPVPGKHARHWLLRSHLQKDDKVLLEEYKTIRAEVTASIQAQISILAFGAATLGFSFAAASQTSNTGFGECSCSSSCRSSPT